MNIGVACAIFQNINSEKYTEDEKVEAIRNVLEMPTHNGITKKEIISAFRWFWNWCVVIDWHTEGTDKEAAAEGVLDYGA